MNFCRYFLRPGRVVATLAGLGVAWSVTAGEPILFSKPAIAIAAPPKAESNLPEIREHGMKFSNPEMEQAPAAPFRPPPPLMRNDPRDEERDNTHRLLRTPKMFTDPAEEKARSEARREARNNPFASTAEKQHPPSPFTKDMATQMRSDESRSLSPVTDLDWQPGDSPNGRKESRLGGLGGPDSASPYARREEAQFGPESGRPVPLFDFSGGRPQEKLTPSQLQRRTDFEQLLNPNAGLAGKGPNSLQPVVNAADAKSATLAIPTVGGKGFDPRTADPMATLNQQRDRLRGPVIEDINKRYNPQPATGSGSPYDSGNNLLNSRQPLSREFPSRKF